jgi:hypothetical protein
VCALSTGQWPDRAVVHRSADSGSPRVSGSTSAALRRAGISLTRIRAATDRLRASWTAAHGDEPTFEPLSNESVTPDRPPAKTAVIAVLVGELFIRHPGGGWEGDRQPGQLILDGILPLPGNTDLEPDRNTLRPRPTAAHPPASPDRETIARFVARENGHRSPKTGTEPDADPGQTHRR